MDVIVVFLANPSSGGTTGASNGRPNWRRKIAGSSSRLSGPNAKGSSNWNGLALTVHSAMQLPFSERLVIRRDLEKRHLICRTQMDGLSSRD
jgi:hypothetical protein